MDSVCRIRKSSRKRTHTLPPSSKSLLASTVRSRTASDKNQSKRVKHANSVCFDEFRNTGDSFMHPAATSRLNQCPEEFHAFNDGKTLEYKAFKKLMEETSLESNFNKPNNEPVYLKQSEATECVGELNKMSQFKCKPSKSLRQLQEVKSVSWRPPLSPKSDGDLKSNTDDHYMQGFLSPSRMDVPTPFFSPAKESQLIGTDDRRHVFAFKRENIIHLAARTLSFDVNDLKLRREDIIPKLLQRLGILRESSNKKPRTRSNFSLPKPDYLLEDSQGIMGIDSGRETAERESIEMDLLANFDETRPLECTKSSAWFLEDLFEKRSQNLIKEEPSWLGFNSAKSNDHHLVRLLEYQEKEEFNCIKELNYWSPPERNLWSSMCFEVSRLSPLPHHFAETHSPQEWHTSTPFVFDVSTSMMTRVSEFHKECKQFDDLENVELSFGKDFQLSSPPQFALTGNTSPHSFTENALVSYRGSVFTDCCDLLQTGLLPWHLEEEKFALPLLLQEHPFTEEPKFCSPQSFINQDFCDTANGFNERVPESDYLPEAESSYWRGSTFEFGINDLRLLSRFVWQWRP